MRSLPFRATSDESKYLTIKREDDDDDESFVSHYFSYLTKLIFKSAAPNWWVATQNWKQATVNTEAGCLSTIQKLWNCFSKWNLIFKEIHYVGSGGGQSNHSGSVLVVEIQNEPKNKPLRMAKIGNENVKMWFDQHTKSCGKKKKMKKLWQNIKEQLN